MNEPTVPIPPMRWDGWGDPAQATELSATQLALVRDALKVTPAPSVEREDVRLRPSALPAELRDALVAIVGEAHVGTADADRLPRAGGKSTVDLLRRKASGEQDAPDAVVLPGTEAEVAAVLALCGEHGIAVVPFGGG